MTARAYGVPPPGYQLPDGTHVGVVRLQVADLERSLAFYTRILGLTVLSNAAGVAVLGAGVPLVALHEKRGVSPAPRHGLFGLYHFAILLPDRAALGRFATHLSEVSVRVGMADHLVSEAFYLTDPDGLGVEVYADRPRSTWQFKGRQLAMATDPLDVPSVIASAQGRPWDGAPAGTRMGHVHLHVGSLPEAETFYHRALGLDKMVWEYPGALFLAAGGYHHHLGTNTWSPGPSATDGEARLLEWELVVPAAADASAAAASLRGGGFEVSQNGRGWLTRDPWGTALRITA
jgi:catechol 2,3-dioxygenase